jgi:hypothetical protein
VGLGLALAVLAGGAGLVVSGGPAAAAPVPGGEGPPLAPATGELADLLKKRYEMAKKEYDVRHVELLAGRCPLEHLHAASRRLLKADVERARTPAQRLQAYRAQVDRAAAIAKVIKEGFEAGRIRAADHYQADYYRLDAEVELRRARGK